MTKKFIGYFIIGAATKKEAISGKGLKAWSTKRPNFLVRFFNRLLLNIRWIDEETHIIKKYESKRKNTKRGFKHNIKKS